MRADRPEIVEITPLLAADQRAAFVRDVRRGLTSDPKRLHSLYFYDDVGRMLFQRIMELPEYYLTRAETQILRAHAGAIAARFAGHPVAVVDLGAGDATKTDLILNALRDAECTLTYLPVDISRATLEHLVERVIGTHAGIAVRPLAAEYFDALRALHTVGDERRLIVFLGSNIGNFPPDRAAEFLVKLRPHVREHDALLVGFDLQKDPALILRAYNDAAGVTAEFNFNLLDRINRELGGDFDRTAFRHYAMYDPLQGVARSFLVSARPQRVRIADIEETIAFAAGEAIHTEDSWKYSLRNIRTLASVSGFSLAAEYLDDEQSFVDAVLA